MIGVLGLLAAVLLIAQGAGGSGRQEPSPWPNIQSSPTHGITDIQAAAAVACRSDYAAVTAAVSEYEALNGKPPTNMAALRPVLTSPANSTEFIINPTRPGEIEVAAAGHPPQPGDANCAYAR
jgi:hypothetical protein